MLAAGDHLKQLIESLGPSGTGASSGHAVATGRGDVTNGSHVRDMAEMEIKGRLNDINN